MPKTSNFHWRFFSYLLGATGGATIGLGGVGGITGWWRSGRGGLAGFV